MLLQRIFKKIFNKHKANAKRLSCIGSTQANESLNMTIASKAPKTRHFSESASLEVRVNAAAAQKNAGYEYVSDVSLYVGLNLVHFRCSFDLNVRSFVQRLSFLTSMSYQMIFWLQSMCSRKASIMEWLHESDKLKHNKLLNGIMTSVCLMLL